MFPELIKKIFAIQFKKSVPSSQQEKKKAYSLIVLKLFMISENPCFSLIAIFILGEPLYF